MTSIQKEKNAKEKNQDLERLTFEEINKKLKEKKNILCKKYKIKKIGIFGSYLRGDAKKESDLDILVEFEPEARISLLEFVELELHIGDILGIKIDLVEKSALKPRIGKHILDEVKYL
ncbi:MAG: nucleotidyltransferase family protein [Promethearchaeota archaeon]